MIFVTGAGGKTSKALIEVLSGVETVCAFVHRQEDAAAVKSFGADRAIIGDLRDPSAIQAAMQGARSVYHICPNMHPDETAIGKLVIEAARKTGAKHFVYHSVLHPQTEAMNHHWQKMRVEEMIFESGLPFTILQPAPYMQNLLANWKMILEDGLLLVPYSVNTKFSFVDLEDIAQAAKAVLTEHYHKNATYELAGTAPLSLVEVAETLGRVLKRNVRAAKEEITDWKLRANHQSAYALESLVKMFEYYDQWGLPGNPNVLSWILKREPTTFELFIDRITKQSNGIN